MSRYRYGDSLPESQERARAARALRRMTTPPERVLWSKLRNRQLGGLKFRRQHPAGSYVLDFFCEAARLAVEVDGDVHALQGARDARRDAWLRGEEIEVLRIPVRVMMKDMDSALATILTHAQRRIAARETMIKDGQLREEGSTPGPPLPQEEYAPFGACQVARRAGRVHAMCNFPREHTHGTRCMEGDRPVVAPAAA